MDYIAEWQGHCPICRHEVAFRSESAWFRDHLVCSSCGSYPRERATMLVIDTIPRWRFLHIHESSPVWRGTSLALRTECTGYVATQLFRDIPLGSDHQGCRCENLEAQTFTDARFDLVVLQDVLEHVFEPDKVCREIWRTLTPGGLWVQTTPMDKCRIKSERRAERMSDGSIRHLAEAEYHGNPVDDGGALVTYDWGYDLPDLIAEWAPFDMTVLRFNDRTHGVVAECTEVIVGRKR